MSDQHREEIFRLPGRVVRGRQGSELVSVGPRRLGRTREGHPQYALMVNATGETVWQGHFEADPDEKTGRTGWLVSKTPLPSGGRSKTRRTHRVVLMVTEEERNILAWTLAQRRDEPVQALGHVYYPDGTMTTVEKNT